MDAPARILKRLVNTGVDADVPVREIRYIRLTNTLALIGIVLNLLNIPLALFFIEEEPYLLAIFLLNVPGLALVFYLNFRGWRLAARLQSNLYSLAHMTTTAVLIGIDTRAHLFIFLIIMAAFFQYPPWQNVYKYLTVALAGAALIGLELTLWDYEPPLKPREGGDRMDSFSVLVNLLLFIIAFMIYNQRILGRAEALLEQEKARADSLLRNAMPAEIVERLKSKPTGAVIADAYPAASVLFADIVGFTGLAASMKPEELIHLLNTIFSEFDRIVERYGLEKIKTIGDAYMVVGGLPRPRSDHLEAVCDLALAMRAAIENMARERSLDLRLRIGIHTGPVAAGVIGLRRFAYDLWGDTVNTASRMESHGNPGEIHVTEAVHAALGDRFAFSERGSIEIKGKGEMRTYFLNARAEA